MFAWRVSRFIADKHSLFIIWSPVALLCSNHEWFLHTVPDRNEDNASPVLESALFFHAWHRTSLLHCLSTVSPIHTNTQCVCSVWLTECSIIRYTLAQFISIWSGYRDGQSIMFLKGTEHLTLDCPYFGWDVKPRSWLSVVILSFFLSFFLFDKKTM